jgi:phosphoglycerate dehydrogenase-like enzyme
LNNRIIGGASIDVVSGENELGFFQNSKLINFAKSFPNLIITPHVAGLTFESEGKAQMFAFKEAMNCL